MGNETKRMPLEILFLFVINWNIRDQRDGNKAGNNPRGKRESFSKTERSQHFDFLLENSMKSVNEKITIAAHLIVM